MWCSTVSDTGAGMDQKTKDRLFEPFFTTKAPGKGTGLGLAAVRGIVTQSGGYVGVESEPLRGTSFKVYLPVAEPGARRPRSLSPPNSLPAEPRAVLIVEDDQSIRALTRMILERAGYRVLDASTSTVAEEVFDREAGGIDLVVTDVALPDGSGPALFRRLFEKRHSLRVLYMSGYADETLVDGCQTPAHRLSQAIAEPSDRAVSQRLDGSQGAEPLNEPAVRGGEAPSPNVRVRHQEAIERVACPGQIERLNKP